MTIYRISFYDVYDDEALEKGYREDLVLKKGNHYFRLYFYPKLFTFYTTI